MNLYYLIPTCMCACMRVPSEQIKIFSSTELREEGDKGKTSGRQQSLLINLYIVHHRADVGNISQCNYCKEGCFHLGLLACLSAGFLTKFAINLHEIWWTVLPPWPRNN